MLLLHSYKEVNERVFANLIEYCYTSKIEINQENVMLLLQTADLLQFDTVRNCHDQLKLTYFENMI